MSFMGSVRNPVGELEAMAFRDPALRCAGFTCWLVARQTGGYEPELVFGHVEGVDRISRAFDIPDVAIMTVEDFYQEHLRPWLIEVHPEPGYQELAPIFEAGLREVPL